MEKKVNWKIISLLGILFIEIAVFLIVFLTTRKTTLVSNIFFGIGVLFTFLLLIQYFYIWRINSQNARNKIKASNFDEQDISKFNKKAKKLKDGSFKKEDLVLARKKRAWSNISFLLLPFICAFIIAIVFAFV